MDGGFANVPKAQVASGQSAATSGMVIDSQRPAPVEAQGNSWPVNSLCLAAFVNRRFRPVANNEMVGNSRDINICTNEVAPQYASSSSAAASGRPLPA